ncbi:hypothetical protein B0A52_08264 [Exophiala mesophila]|uniref:Uncharacterized protein n=1 Tax=Exophiala mesophila TaxID=212818 RepID=A0A438MYD8_EXOME|nr:hypothetical protein B0A52_08264 [Exophiala mesophila]
MELIQRSIPGHIAGEQAPPVTTKSDSQGTMAGSAMLTFFQTVVLPMLISAALYLVIFHALLPLYRRHRARYSQYLPLQSSSFASHLPEALQPSTLRDRMSVLFFRLFLPSTWAFRNRFGRRDSIISADGELFDEESGEAMIGFDVQERNHRRDGMERQVSDMNAAARTVARSQRLDPADLNPRLSRELEEGFRDDSEDEGQDQSPNPTAQRNTVVTRP